MALDSVLAAHRRLGRCVTFCRHCGIRFLCHPRNAGRPNLRCPFGCREQHRKQRSSQRSTAYYQTDSGKWKKKRINARRSLPPVECDQPREPLEQTASAEEPTSGGRDELSVKVELRLETVVLRESSLASSPTLPYVRMLVSLVEGFRLTIEEVVRLLHRSMRQHSFAHRKRIDYVLDFLHQHPP